MYIFLIPDVYQYHKENFNLISNFLEGRTLGFLGIPVDFFFETDMPYNFWEVPKEKTWHRGGGSKSRFLPWHHLWMTPKLRNPQLLFLWARGDQPAAQKQIFCGLNSDWKSVFFRYFGWFPSVFTKMRPKKLIFFGIFSQCGLKTDLGWPPLLWAVIWVYFLWNKIDIFFIKYFDGLFRLVREWMRT